MFWFKVIESYIYKWVAAFNRCLNTSWYVVHNNTHFVDISFYYKVKTFPIANRHALFLVR